MKSGVFVFVLNFSIGELMRNILLYALTVAKCMNYNSQTAAVISY